MVSWLPIFEAHFPFWNISDLGVKCKNRGTINTITLENGELVKQS